MGGAACSVGHERARHVRSRLLAAPAALEALEAELSQPQVAAADTISRLAELLHVLHSGIRLKACEREARKRNASAGFDRLDLDAIRLHIWRLHAQVRKRTTATNIAAPSPVAAVAPAAAGRPLRLLPLGDSITDGGAKQRSYRYHLHLLLERYGYRRIQWLGSMAGIFDKSIGRNASRGTVLRGRAHADWPVAAQAHEGHWGWTSRQVLRGHDRQPQRGALHAWLERLRRRAVLEITEAGARAHSIGGTSAGGTSTTRSDDAEQGAAQGMPDVALVHLGTNDLTKLVLKPGHGPRERVQATARRVHAIVSMLCVANPHMHVVLAMPIPYCRFRVGSKAERAAQLARRRAAEAAYARKLCAPKALAEAAKVCAAPAAGVERVACVNMSRVVRCEHLVADGVHPAADGARRMAAEWMRALEPRLLRGRGRA